MVFFGHIGITTVLINKFERVFKNKELDVDYRVVIAGSILPDLIDKPIEILLKHYQLISGRLIGHTLAFSMIIVIIGLIRLKKTKKSNILILGACSLIHTILDLMWVFPKTYLYPLYGMTFPAVLDTLYLPHYAKLYFSHYSYFALEIVGLGIFYKCKDLYSFKKKLQSSKASLNTSK